jgi:hypothetical protein
MLKIIARTILFLLIAVLVSGELFAFAKSDVGRAWLGVAGQDSSASAPASQGSGAATVKSSSSSQNSDYEAPSTLTDVLQKLGIVLEFTIGVVILQKILSLFIKKPAKSKTFESED